MYTGKKTKLNIIIGLKTNITGIAVPAILSPDSKNSIKKLILSVINMLKEVATVLEKLVLEFKKIILYLFN